MIDLHSRNQVAADCWESKEQQLRRMDKLEQKIKTGLYDIHVSRPFEAARLARRACKRTSVSAKGVPSGTSALAGRRLVASLQRQPESSDWQRAVPIHFGAGNAYRLMLQLPAHPLPYRSRRHHSAFVQNPPKNYLHRRLHCRPPPKTKRHNALPWPRAIEQDHPCVRLQLRRRQCAAGKS